MRVTYGPSAEPAPISGTRRPVRDSDEEGCAPDAGRREHRAEDVVDVMHAPAGRRMPLTVMDRDIVESESYPGTYYELYRRADGTWTCTCPGFQYRSECKHARRRADYDKRR